MRSITAVAGGGESVMPSICESHASPLTALFQPLCATRVEEGRIPQALFEGQITLSTFVSKIPIHLLVICSLLPLIRLHLPAQY